VGVCAFVIGTIVEESWIIHLLVYESQIRYSFGNAFCFIVVRSQKQFANFYWKREIRTSQYAELEMHSSQQKATTPHHWSPRTVLEVSSPLLAHPARYVIKLQHPANRYASGQRQANYCRTSKCQYSCKLIKGETTHLEHTASSPAIFSFSCQKFP
jgi:hypothetical protein